MAQVFPLNPDPSDEGRAALIRTLAALPDDWTLLCARRLGDEPSCAVDAVLIHAEIGLALIDLAPGEPAPAVAALRQQLEREGFVQYFPGDLPIVSLSIPAETLGEAGEQLADAFEAAPRLSISDMDWADAVIELLLVPDDVAMAGPDEEAEAALAAAPAAVASEDIFEEDEESEAAFEEERESEAGFAAEPTARPAAATREEPEATAWAATEEAEPEHLRLIADAPAMALYDRRSWGGQWVAIAAAVVLMLGLGAGAWQLADEGGSGGAPEAAGSAEVAVPIAPSGPDAAASAHPSPPAPPPSPPVRLAAKNFAKAPPSPPTPTRIDLLPPPKPPVEMTAKNFAEAPPAPPTPTKVEPLPQPTPAAPAAVANTPRRAPPPSATSRPAERQVAQGAQAPRQKPRRAAQQDETPVRQLMERQIDHPTATTQDSGAPVREARAHPPIDAGDLPPLEEGATQAPSREPAAAPAPSPSTAAIPVGPPIRLLGPPGAPAPVTGSSVPTTPAAIAAAPAGGNGANPRECRPYTADTTLSGGRAPVQGIACRGADGQWRLVSEVPAR